MSLHSGLTTNMKDLAMYIAHSRCPKVANPCPCPQQASRDVTLSGGGDQQQMLARMRGKKEPSYTAGGNVN
jgi:hypothetical protein